MIPFDLPPRAVLIGLFVLGTLLGSFLNVCIDRFPRFERLADQLRSLRPQPRRRGVIPFAAWLQWDRGWGSPHGRRYALVEVASGLLWAGVYWFEIPFAAGAGPEASAVHTPLGPQGDGLWSAEVWMHVRYLYHMLLLEALLVASVIDLETMLIPDGSTLPAMLAGIVLAGAVGQVYLVPVWFEDRPLLASLPGNMPSLIADPVDVRTAPRPSPFLEPDDAVQVPGWTRHWPRLHNLAVSLVGLVVGGGVVWGVRLIAGWVLRREAMGFGDVILMALVGSYVGWQPVLVVFFLAPVCALAVVAVRWVVRRDEMIPYGPYLSLGALLLLLAWRPIWPVAQRLFATGLWVPVVLLAMGLLLALLLLLIQVVKWLLGIPLDWDEPDGTWTSADQLSHFAGEWVDPQQGQWRRPDTWPGIAAARGQIHEDRWRRGTK